MKKIEHKAKLKPLSFDTTMRNPERIAGFLNCLLEFEGQTLTNAVIHKIVKKVIASKLYKPNCIKHSVALSEIYNSEENTFSDRQLEEIILNAPQKHKEAGFDKGWPSRFETWFNLPKEYGFVWYKIDNPIVISATGHMLIDAYNQSPVDNNKIQNVFTNAMCRYQSANPFRKTLLDNVPFILLLKVLKRFKESDEDSAGIFRQELSFFICWPDSNDEKLYNYIKDFRKLHRYSQYTDEIIYNRCLKLLGYGEEEKSYIKMEKVTGETVDEYIRKMRITGLLSLRGNGRFLDINKFKEGTVNYVLNKYKSYTAYTTEEEFFEYMSSIDNNLFEVPEIEQQEESVMSLRKNKLKYFAETFSKDFVISELENLCFKRESRDAVLKFINAPARLEFLTSIALKQNIDNLDVNPNYAIDDEGLPITTAGGGIADIICKEKSNDDFVEVTLITSGTGQMNNEMLSISRHQKEARKTNQSTYSFFIAPRIHPDVERWIRWIKYDENLDIKAYSIIDFINAVKETPTLTELINGQ